MRIWRVLRLLLDTRCVHDPDQLGVYDRRPNISMFYMRVLSVLVVVIVYVLVVFPHYDVMYVNKQTTKSVFEFPPGQEPQPQERQQRSPLLQPNQHQLSTLENNHQLLTLNGSYILTPDSTEIVIQAPPLSSGSSPRGLVLLLHGCSHSATDFWPRSKYCETCTGLPEETKIVSELVRTGYTAMAVSSTDRRSLGTANGVRCWKVRASLETPDYQRIETALKVAQRLRVNTSPLYVVGISSGGYFASTLPLRFTITGIVSIVSPGVPWFLENRMSAHLRNSFTTRYPPVAYVHMSERDGLTAATVTKNVQHLKKHGIASMAFEVSPKAVTPDYLAQSMPHWGLPLAGRVVRQLQANGFLDSTYFLTNNPRHSGWRDALSTLRHDLPDSLIADASPLSEELNRAWAEHECTAEHFRKALEYLRRSA